MDKDRCNLTDEELIEKCRAEVSRLCQTGGKAWNMRVPVDFNNDSDMLLSEIIRRFELLKKYSSVNPG